MVKFAVIVPAHNESQVIQRTINALFLADIATADIYVVDDASSDNTSQIAHDMGVQVLTLVDNVGKSEALNTAIKTFALCDRYSHVAFLDADTIVRTNYFEVLREEAEANPNVSLFLGQVESSRGSYISALRTFEYKIGHDLYKMGQSNFNVVFVAPGCASLYRSDVLRRLRYEGDTLAEDMDLTIQVHYLGGRVLYVDDAIVTTQDPANFRDYTKQTLRWQRGGWQVFKKHRIHLFGKKRGIDFFLWGLMFDALIFNRLIVFLPLALLFGVNYWVAAITEVATLLGMATYSGVKSRRADVIYKLPCYFWIFYVNQYTYVKSFIEVMVLNRTVLDWARVKRY